MTTQQDDPTTLARNLFRGLPDRYDRLAEILSLGQNRRWRRAVVDHVVPAAPPVVLDVSSGTAGGLAGLLPKRESRLVQLNPFGRTIQICPRPDRLPWTRAAWQWDGFTNVVVHRTRVGGGAVRGAGRAGGRGRATAGVLRTPPW